MIVCVTAKFQTQSISKNTEEKESSREWRDAPQPWHAGKQGSQICVGKHLPTNIHTHFLKPAHKNFIRNAATAIFQRCLQHAATNVLQLRGRARANNVIGAYCEKRPSDDIDIEKNKDNS
jgi:hypothetical protein